MKSVIKATYDQIPLEYRERIDTTLYGRTTSGLTGDTAHRSKFQSSLMTRFLPTFARVVGCEGAANTAPAA